MTLGETIRARRKDLKLTLRALGNKASVSAAFINDIEFGRRNPSPETLKNIAKAMNCWTILKTYPCSKCNGSGTREGKTLTWKQ